VLHISDCAPTVKHRVSKPQVEGFHQARHWYAIADPPLIQNKEAFLPACKNIVMGMCDSGLRQRCHRAADLRAESIPAE
jgi:hypothetical protein